jgi:CelD/BcsL family acetyltransferase involved in cellulose biosynthesis
MEAAALRMSYSPASTSPNCVIEVASTYEEVDRRRESWADLAQRGLEDNVYLSPDYLPERLKHRKNEYFVLFIYDDTAAGKELIGVAPFSLEKPSIQAPMPRAFTLYDFHVYLSYPLVDRDRGAAAIGAIWDWLDQRQRRFDLVVIRNIGRRSPTWALIRTELERRRRPFWIKHVYEQGMLQKRASFDDYLNALSRIRRKGYRRKLRKLESGGDVQFVLHRNLEKSPDLIQRYLDLELKSWKAEKHVAVAQDEATRDFFEKATRRLAARDQLFFIEVVYDNRPIAMSVNYVSGATIFGLRIAYDLDYHMYSPGVLCEIEAVRFLHDFPELQYLQGGNDADDSYLNHYWFDVAEMQNISVATPSIRSRTYLWAAPKVQAVLDWLSALRTRGAGSAE